MSNSPPIIIDEFLTFVKNKIDVLDEISITQICVSNFTDSEIEAGKLTLIKELPEGGTRNITRKGDDKSKKNVKDIIKLLKESDPSVQPIFVAKNINRLPAITFDHVDVTRLLKDLTEMKEELQNLRNDTSTKAELNKLQTKISSDFTNLRTTMSKFSKECCCLMSTTKPQQQSRSENPNQIVTTPVKQPTKECTDMQLSGASVPTVPARSRSKSKDIVHTPTYRDIVLPDRRQPVLNVIRSTNKNKVDDGFTLVTYKKRKSKQNMCGTATGPSKIQAAEQFCSVYISRLTKSTTVDNIREHITEKKQKYNDIVMLKQTKETDFNSFKITIIKSDLDVFLSNEFWPVGVKYRKYREYARSQENR